MENISGGEYGAVASEFTLADKPLFISASNAAPDLK